MGIMVEFEQTIPARLLGTTTELRPRIIYSKTDSVKLDGIRGEQGPNGQWTLTRYERRTDETITEDGFADLGKLLDRVASVLEIDPKCVRVFKEAAG